MQAFKLSCMQLRILPLEHSREYRGLLHLVDRGAWSPATLYTWPLPKPATAPRAAHTTSSTPHSLLTRCRALSGVVRPQWHVAVWRGGFCKRSAQGED